MSESLLMPPFPSATTFYSTPPASYQIAIVHPLGARHWAMVCALLELRWGEGVFPQVHVLLPGTCEYAWLHGKGELQLRMLSS